MTNFIQCGRNPMVLQQTYTLMERAVSLDNDNSDYITELGFQLLLQGKIKDAMRCYKNAMKLDETSVSALTGGCELVEYVKIIRYIQLDGHA